MNQCFTGVCFQGHREGAAGGCEWGTAAVGCSGAETPERFPPSLGSLLNGAIPVAGVCVRGVHRAGATVLGARGCCPTPGALQAKYSSACLQVVTANQGAP